MLSSVTQHDQILFTVKFSTLNSLCEDVTISRITPAFLYLFSGFPSLNSRCRQRITADASETHQLASAYRTDNLGKRDSRYVPGSRFVA